MTKLQESWGLLTGSHDGSSPSDGSGSFGSGDTSGYLSRLWKSSFEKEPQIRLSSLGARGEWWPDAPPPIRLRAQTPFRPLPGKLHSPERSAPDGDHPARGRIPKWCSPSCRHRAWELTRAAVSGRAAVQVVDRVVEVDRLVTVVQEVPVTKIPKGAAWPAALDQLAAELDTGRVYDRDLPALAEALAGVADALDRRPGRRRQPR